MVALSFNKKSSAYGAYIVMVKLTKRFCLS